MLRIKTKGKQDGDGMDTDREHTDPLQISE